VAIVRDVDAAQPQRSTFCEAVAVFAQSDSQAGGTQVSSLSLDGRA